MNFWNNHIFVLITPDAIVRNKFSKIIDRLVENGFKPVYFRKVKATSHNLDSLYALHIGEMWDTYRYRLVDKLFDLDNCIALIVKAENEFDCYNRLKRLKGNSNPCNAEEGTIRRDFGGVNSILGLIHTSDSPFESERESAIFLKKPIELNSEDVTGILRSIDYPYSKGGYIDVVKKLRKNLILTVYQNAKPKDRELIEQIINNLFSDVFKETIKQLEIEDELKDFITFDFNKVNPNFEGDRLKKLLIKYDLHLDDWEKLVLSSSMYFKPTLESEQLNVQS